ncbi:TPA: hypothetical protein PIP08_002457 [Klebsiella aerogenes]|nr:hypothetical protein [Klebsiella aerogenes]
MTDITRLLASLKRRSAHAKEFGDSITFVKLEDIDALVEALEKAQQRNTELENYAKAEAVGADKAAEDSVYWMKRCKELESRAVSVKLPEVERPIDGTGYAKAAGARYYKECVIKALTAQGIKWEAE